MALVDSSGRAVRSGSGRAVGSGTSSGNNSGGGGGGGGAARAARAQEVKRLQAAKKSREQMLNTITFGGNSPVPPEKQIYDKVAAQQAQAQAVAQATANRKIQDQIAAAERQQQQQQNQQGIAAYKAMMEGPVVAGNPSVVGNTYANAPTQFTEGRSGTSYYPENAPDTMFRGLMGNLTGGGLLSGAADMVGEDNPVGGFLKAYSEFDPLGDLAQQTVYGMNDIARDEYVRQEASNPSWPMMSEKERVQLARKPQTDKQAILDKERRDFLYRNGGGGEEFNGMRYSTDDNRIYGNESRRDISSGESLDKNYNPFILPVEEEVAPESYTSYMADYSPMFSFAGKSGLSSFAEGGEVESQGVGRLFEDMNRPAPMDPILEHHYKNLAQGKAVQHEDGTVSTVYTIQEDIDGVPTLIPTVWDGQILSNDAAIQRALASGKNWPTASTHDELIEYDKKLHENMQNMPAEAAQMMLMQQ